MPEPDSPQHLRLDPAPGSAPRPSGPHGALQCLAGSHDLTAIIMAAMAANMVRALQFAAVRAFRMGLAAQRQMAATHTRTRRRGFSLRNGHGTAPLRLCDARTPDADGGSDHAMTITRAGPSSRARPHPQAIAPFRISAAQAWQPPDTPNGPRERPRRCQFFRRKAARAANGDGSGSVAAAGNSASGLRGYGSSDSASCSAAASPRSMYTPS